MSNIVIKTPFSYVRLDFSYEIPYLAGYSKDGSVIYIDRRLNPHLLLSDGRTMNIILYIVIHEFFEKFLESPKPFKCPPDYLFDENNDTIIDITEYVMDGIQKYANKQYSYPFSHETSTGKVERPAVIEDGYIWDEYQTYALSEVKRLIKLDRAEPLPKDYDDTPERDTHDYYLLKKIHEHQKIDCINPKRIKSISMHKPHILIQAENNPIILNQIIDEIGPRIYQMMKLTASIKALDRYNLRVGRLFGIGKDRYKVVELCGNVVVYKDFQKDKLIYEPVNELLKKWNLQGAYEISTVDAIIEKIKSWLTPFLGAVLVAALINWLVRKLK